MSSVSNASQQSAVPAQAPSADAGAQFQDETLVALAPAPVPVATPAPVTPAVPGGPMAPVFGVGTGSVEQPDAGVTAFKAEIDKKNDPFYAPERLKSTLAAVGSTLQSIAQDPLGLAGKSLGLTEQNAKRLADDNSELLSQTKNWSNAAEKELAQRAGPILDLLQDGSLTFQEASKTLQEAVDDINGREPIENRIFALLDPEELKEFEEGFKTSPLWSDWELARDRASSEDVDKALDDLWNGRVTFNQAIANLRDGKLGSAGNGNGNGGTGSTVATAASPEDAGENSGPARVPGLTPAQERSFSDKTEKLFTADPDQQQAYSDAVVYKDPAAIAAARADYADGKSTWDEMLETIRSAPRRASSNERVPGLTPDQERLFSEKTRDLFTADSAQQQAYSEAVVDKDPKAIAAARADYADGKSTWDEMLDTIRNSPERDASKYRN